MLSRPSADEYFEYFGTYISLVPDGDVRDILRSQLSETTAVLSGVPDAKANKAYGPGKDGTEVVFGFTQAVEATHGDNWPLPR